MTAPDFYLSPTATLDDVEQLIFTFFPESLVEEEPAPPPPPSEPPARGRRRTPPAPSKPREPPQIVADLMARLRGGIAPLALAYLAVYATGEVLAAALDPRLGIVVHAGLLLAVFLHGANVPPGPERAFFWTLWLAPLTRIYALAQPYAGAQPLAWWALTAVPMVVAAVVAIRLVGLGTDDAGLKPSLRELPVAVFMAPVGLAIGLVQYLALEPRPFPRELPFGGLPLAVLIIVLNPGIVEEVVFRGVLQRGAVAALGSVLGLVYVSLLYAFMMPAGLADGPTLLGLTITFMTGLLLAVVTARTGSILSASVAHASLALSLYLISPQLVPGSVGTPAPTPSVPPAVGATAKPAASASPIVVPAPASQAPANPAMSSQAPAGTLPTPITLAPPLAPQPTAPPAAASPASEPAGSPSAAPTGQIVVVRGTGGSGARLRAQPGNSGAIITVVPEYTPLVVIGQDRIVDGIVWRNVRAPSGGEGWLAASLLTSGQQ